MNENEELMDLEEAITCIFGLFKKNSNKFFVKMFGDNEETRGLTRHYWAYMLEQTLRELTIKTISENLKNSGEKE